MEYYHSPGPGGMPPPEQAAPAQAKRSRRRGRLILILFSLAILLSAAGLAILHILFPENWNNSLADFFQPFDIPGFSFQIPGDTNDDFSDHWNQSGTATSIPRADLAPDVQMTLHTPSDKTMPFQDIYEKVLPAIVSIQASANSNAYEGTGVIMTADGYVITNYHIITGCSSARVVLFDGTDYEAKLVGSDVASDLAVLKIEATDLVCAEFGDSDFLRAGDTVLALGNPLGSELFGTLTEGIISAINRDITVDGYEMSLIQTTAALNPGNSGGALINTAGQVVGITNMKMMSSYETIEGLGFAIPSCWAKEVVDVLLAQGAITGRPTIGIMCQTLLPGDAEVYGRDSGVWIQSVTAGGPADLAGVQATDIIVQANGNPIASLEDLTVARDEAGVGGELILTVWRDGELLDLTLILVEQHELS